ncbi:GNAT family N-acetyltransferase [Halobacillus yeomjeoni]|uniref:GNAT family N-acetyltransferase n=1 Tax=Halobacillus yeomjeoni TaxID=311194 RepID=A0A931HXX8_9BACI|nr:GNAT family N-acetyltransferase [Halobacillus yeomjeoni]MBH0231474.1 GNAT family N-acetyltransferase [Halobacillus yeomjeoni]
MDITLREARLADYQNMLELYKELDDMHRMEYPELFIEPEGEVRPFEYIQKQIEEDDKYLVVAETADRIIGFAECAVMESSSFPVLRKRKWVELNSLVVRKGDQGMGTGKMLLDRVVMWSRERKINRIELQVYTFNSGALDFYKKKGFQNLHSRMYLDV